MAQQKVDTVVKTEAVKTDALVIGAGIIGAAIAEHLAADGREVLLLDRHAPGQGCSGGNAGHFATDVVLPLANPDTLLGLPKMLLDPLGPLSLRWSYLPRMLPWLTRFALAALPANAKASAEALRSLNRESIVSYDRLLTRTGLQHLMTKRGAITLYQTVKGQAKHASTVQLLRNYGVNVEALDTQQLLDLEPALTADISGGLFFPDTAHTVDPLALVTQLVNAFVANGGRFEQADVEQIQQQDNNAVLVKTSQGDYLAKKIVIATGAWSKPLMAMLGHKVPLDTERGYHLTLPNPEAALTRPTTAFERSFVMTPLSAGLRLAGTVELAGLDAPENPSRADILYQHAQTLLPGLNREGATRWMGCRPSLPDSLPVIGPSPNSDAVFFAFGHQHLGLTQAAITAEIMGELIRGSDGPGTNASHGASTSHINLSPFRVDRF